MSTFNVALMCSSLIVHPIVPHGENHNIIDSAQYICLSCFLVIDAVSSPYIIAWYTPVALYSSQFLHRFHPASTMFVTFRSQSPFPRIVESTYLLNYGITASCLFTDNSFCLSTSIVLPARTSISATQSIIPVDTHSWQRCHPLTSWS